MKNLFQFDQSSYDEGFIDAQAGNIDHDRWTDDHSYMEGVEDALDIDYISKYKEN